LGIILVEKGDRESLFHKLKENIGRSLADIGELEMDLKHDQEEEGPIRPTVS